MDLDPKFSMKVLIGILIGCVIMVGGSLIAIAFQESEPKPPKYLEKGQSPHIIAMVMPSDEELRVLYDKALHENERLKAEGRDTYDPKDLSLIKAAMLEAVSTLTKRDDVLIVDRTRLDAVLEQHQFEQSTWSDSNKVAEIGKALNADKLAFITFADNPFIRSNKLEERVPLILEIVSVNTFAKRSTVLTYAKGLRREFMKGIYELNLNFK